MTANITILVQEEEGLVIPLEATQYTIDPPTMQMLQKQGYTVDGKAAPGDGVWVLSGKTLKRCGLTLGISDGANVIVTSGLKEGDRVVRNVSLKEEGKEEGSSMRMGPPERKKRE